MATLLSFLILLFSRYVESDLLYDVLNKVDTCETYCEKTYPGIYATNAKYRSCCQQGCRFFTLVHLIEDREKSDLNVTKEACQASCMEAYSHTKDRYACNLGCARMAKQKKVDSLVGQIRWSVYVEGSNSVLMLQTAGDFEPDDVLTDPGLRNQLENSWKYGPGDSHGNTNQGIDRLPETYVKTLPIEEDEITLLGNNNGIQTGGDWLDCAARKSGLPRLLLAGAVMSVVILSLWLYLASERRITKLPLDEPKDSFDCPPKYSLQVEKM